MKLGTIFLTLAGTAVAAEGQRQQQAPLGGGHASTAWNWKDAIAAALWRDGVVPDVLSPSFKPHSKFDVVWNYNKVANLGNAFKPKVLKKRPTLFQLYRPANDAGSAELYNKDVVVINDIPSLDDFNTQKWKTIPTRCENIVLALTDADAPSHDNPIWSEVCHNLIYCHANNATELVPYKAPAPPKKTGYHRYIWVALSPANNTLDKLNLRVPKERYRWGAPKNSFPNGVQNWMHEHGLEAIGVNWVISKHKKQ